MHLCRYLFRSVAGDGAPWWSPPCVEWRGDAERPYEWGIRDVLDVDCPRCLVLLDAALARGEVVVREWHGHGWVHAVEVRDVEAAS